LNANTFIRQFHRWVSAAFVVIVLITWVTLAKKGPIWVSYTPLFPLALLAISGIYMFFRPYFGKSRAPRRAAAELKA
jgi:heme A synthase